MTVDRSQYAEDSEHGLRALHGLDYSRLQTEIESHLASVRITEAELHVLEKHFPGASVAEAWALIYTLRAVQAPWMHSILRQFPPSSETPYRLSGPWSVFLDINRFGDISAILRGRPEDRDRFLATVYELFDELFLKYGYRLHKEPGGDSLFAVCQPPGDDRTFALGAAHIVQSIPLILERVAERIPDIMGILRGGGVDRLTASSAISNEWLLGADIVLGNNQIVQLYDLRPLLDLQKTAGRGACKTTAGVIKSLSIPGLSYTASLTDTHAENLSFTSIPEYNRPPCDNAGDAVALLRKLVDDGHDPHDIATYIGAYLRPATRETIARDTIQTSEVRSVAAVHLPFAMSELSRGAASPMIVFFNEIAAILNRSGGEHVRLMTVDEDKLFLEGTDLRVLFSVCHSIRQAAESHRLPCRIGIAEGRMRRGPLAGIAPRRDLEQSDALVTAVRLATNPNLQSGLALMADLGHDPRLRGIVTLFQRVIPVKEGFLECSEVTDVNLDKETPPPELLERDAPRERLFHHQFSVVTGGRGIGKSEFLRQCDPCIRLVGRDIEADLWRHFKPPDCDSAYSRNALFNALRASDGEERLVIGIDDLHACDSRELYFLSYLIKRLEDEGINHVFIVGTCNPDMRPEFTHELITAGFQDVTALQPLSPDAVSQLIARDSRIVLLPEQSVAALKRLGGLPRLVLDTLPYYRYAAEQDTPADPAAIMLEYLHKLVPDRADFDLMARCSIFPHEFSLEYLEGLYDDPQRAHIADGLRRLSAYGVLEFSGDERYRFRVEPLRLTAYDSVPSERCEWHRRAALHSTYDPLAYLYHMNVLLSQEGHDDVTAHFPQVLRVAAQQGRRLFEHYDFHGALRIMRPTLANLDRHEETLPPADGNPEDVFELLGLMREALVHVNEPSEAFLTTVAHFERASHLSHDERYQLLLKLFRIARLSPRHFARFSRIMDDFHAEFPVPDLCLLRDFLADRMDVTKDPTSVLAEQRYAIDPFSTSLPAPEAGAYARNRIFLLIRAGRLNDAVTQASQLVTFMEGHRDQLDGADQINCLYNLLFAVYQHQEQNPSAPKPVDLEHLERYIQEIISLAEKHHMPHRKAQGMSMRIEFRDFDLARILSPQELTDSSARLPVDLTPRCNRVLTDHFSDAGIPVDQSRSLRIAYDLDYYRFFYIQRHCLGNSDFLPDRRFVFQSHIAEKKDTATWIMQRFAPDSDMHIQAEGLLAEALFVEGGQDNMDHAGRLIRHVLEICMERLSSPTDFYKKLYDKMAVLWAYFMACYETTERT